MSTYPKFKPIPRLHRKVVLTEKINGTNGLIEVTLVDDFNDPHGIGTVVVHNGEHYVLRAGSRNRWLTPDDDNFGFARWVWDNAYTLVNLGAGKHYGEWFGKGIQSGYGLDEKRFALFNVSKWYDPKDTRLDAAFHETFPNAKPAPSGVTVVPVISVINGEYLNYAVDDALNTLESDGSFISPGFMDPEGVVVWHDAAGVYLKATIKNDEQPKSQVAAK